MTNFKRVFGDKKPVIAMVHLRNAEHRCTTKKAALGALSRKRARILRRSSRRG
jgi:hypothetical protein